MAIEQKRVKLSIVKFPFIALFLLIPSIGWSQEESGNQDLPTIMTSTLQATSTSLELIGLLAPLLSSSVGLTAQSTIETQNAQRYVKQNAVALIQDIHLGSGTVMHDVYRLLRVPTTGFKALDKRIRQRRKHYIALIKSPTSVAFIKTLRQDICHVIHPSKQARQCT